MFPVNEMMVSLQSHEGSLYSQGRAAVSTTRSKGTRTISGRAGVLRPWRCSLWRAVYFRSSGVREVSKNSALNVLCSVLSPLGAVKNTPFQKLVSSEDKPKNPWGSLYGNICWIAVVWNQACTLQGTPVQNPQHLSLVLQVF